MTMKYTFFKKIVSLSLLVTSLGVSMSAPFLSAAHAGETNNVSLSSQTVSQTDTSKNLSDTEWPAAPQTEAANVILIDADTGGILYEKDADKRCYPASTTKILTGLLTIENCSMDETVTFSTEAANSVKWDEANLASKPGEQFTVDQALHGLLMYSANEMAYGLAEHVAGNLSSFVDMMNERAKELGAKNTHFNNASGLYDPNHYTTARDLALIARGCYNNASFINIDSTYTSYTIPPTNMTSTPRTFQHRHMMLKNRAYYYEYCKGGKTGFTDQSQYTLVTFAEKDDMRLIAVCLNGSADGRFMDTRALFDWGFNNFKKVTSAGNTLSSLLSSDNYYNSAVYNKYNVNFNLDASSLTIPNNGSVGSVSIKADDTDATTDENGDFKTLIDFKYGDHTVGSANLTLSTTDRAKEASNLPYITSEDETNAPKAKKCFVINIWVLGGIALVGIIAFYIFHDLKQSRERKARFYQRKRRRRY